jgi:hypothetical protein
MPKAEKSLATRRRQPGSAEYTRPQKFRERLDGWLELVRTMRSKCSAYIDEHGTGFSVDRAHSVSPDGGIDGRY